MRRLSRLASAVALTALVAAVPVVAALLEGSSRTTAAAVIEKSERAEEGLGLAWRRVYQVQVTFTPERDESVAGALERWVWAGLYGSPTPQPLDAAVRPLVRVSRATFDRLRPGNTVQVRYAPLFPERARLSEYSVLDYAVLAHPVSLFWFWPGALLAASLFAWLAAVVVGRTLRRWPAGARLVGRTALVLGILALQAFSLAVLGVGEEGGLGRLLPRPGGEALEARAVVQEITPVTGLGLSSRRGRSLDLPEPFERVLLAFVPAGQDDPVVAVDEVDRGSVAGLAEGAEVPITYAAGDPRRAAPRGATYRHRWANALAVHGFYTGVSLLAVAAFTTVRGRRRRGAVAAAAALPA